MTNYLIASPATDCAAKSRGVADRGLLQPARLSDCEADRSEATSSRSRYNSRVRRATPSAARCAHRGRCASASRAAPGLHVVIDAREPRVLAATREELLQFGLCTAIAGDVTDERHVRALFAAAQEFGRLDLLVNNASSLGEVPLPRTDRLSQRVLRTVFDVNVFAPVRLMQFALEPMRQSGLGTIVNITSDAGVEAYPTWGGYGASKAALEHISRVFAEELAGGPVRVLVADPGDMNTQMHRDAIPDADPGTLRDPADSARALLTAVASMQGSYERVRLADVVRV
jgi:NAD(P)-dependent dehydrogenase (short-subunit alcohol dehydrogenase family)